jgi:hypothetical protein
MLLLIAGAGAVAAGLEWRDGRAYNAGLAATVGTAAGTAILALATYGLALQTRQATREGREQANMAAREARRANAFPSAIDLFREYRNSEMTNARRIVRSQIPDASATRIEDLPAWVAQAVISVSHYFDNLGVLVDHDLLEAELAAGFLGDTVTEMWGLLSPIIRSERQLGSFPHYQRYFESLARHMKEIGPQRAVQHLGTMPE